MSAKPRVILKPPAFVVYYAGLHVLLAGRRDQQRLVFDMVLTGIRFEELHDELAAWLAKHGIDENRVKVPGVIERDTEKRQIRYTSYVWDEETDRPKFHHDANESGPLREEMVTVQLESPPLPWPDIMFDERWERTGDAARIAHG